MKRLAVVIAVAVMMGDLEVAPTQTAWARSPEAALSVFRKDTLPTLQEAFSQAEISDAGSLRLLAAESFESLGDTGQRAAVRRVLSGWTEALGARTVRENELIEILEPVRRSLWRLADQETLDVALVDRWDPNAPLAIGGGSTSARRRPWYLYGGGSLSIVPANDTDKTPGSIGAGANFRVGTFLILNRLDTALTLSTNHTESVNPTGVTTPVSETNSTSVGLLGRVHFPVSQKVSLNTGLHVATGPAYRLLGGLGLYTGPGIYDVGVSIGLNTASGWNLSTGYNIFF